MDFAFNDNLITNYVYLNNTFLFFSDNLGVND